jgi:hypothetical protein
MHYNTFIDGFGCLIEAGHLRLFVINNGMWLIQGMLDIMMVFHGAYLLVVSTWSLSIYRCYFLGELFAEFVFHVVTDQYTVTVLVNGIHH